MPGANIPSAVVPLVASATRTTSGNTGNLKDTSANLPLCDSMSIYLDVTAQTAAQLYVYLETSVDGGTTWYTAVGFSIISASTGTRRLDWHTGTGWAEVGAEGSATYTVQNKTNTPLTRDVRVAWNIVGTSVTFAVWAICTPMGLKV
jgi:hypothetical protein